MARRLLEERVGLPEWSGQIFPTHLTGGILNIVDQVIVISRRALQYKERSRDSRDFRVFSSEIRSAYVRPVQKGGGPLGGFAWVYKLSVLLLF